MSNQSDRVSLIRLASSLPAGSPERKVILAGLLSIPVAKEAAVDPGLRKALAAWKSDTQLWEKGHARRGGKTVLMKRMGWRSETPDFSKMVDEINAKFFKGSGYHIEVTGPVTDRREPPNKDYSEKNFSYQEYVILPDGVGKTASMLHPGPLTSSEEFKQLKSGDQITIHRKPAVVIEYDSFDANLIYAWKGTSVKRVLDAREAWAWEPGEIPGTSVSWVGPGAPVGNARRAPRRRSAPSIYD